MRTTTTITTLALLSPLLAFSTALTIADIPECAQECFSTAVASSSCGILDAYCQCTTGAEQISRDSISCLCQSTCTATDLAKVQQVSNSLCSAALSASSQTYAAVTAGLEVCQTTGTAGSGSGTTTAAASDANATGDSDGSDSGSASVDAQSGNAAAPAVTGAVGFQEAVMGVVGLGLMAL